MVLIHSFFYDTTGHDKICCVLSDDGLVLENRILNWDQVCPPVKFDLQEHEAHYGQKSAEIDLRDVGCWLSNGDYIPPDADFRQCFKHILRKCLKRWEQAIEVKMLDASLHQTIRAIPCKGATLNAAANDVINLAQKIHRPIILENFNGTNVLVRPENTVEEVVLEWERIRAIQQRAYESSDVYKQNELEKQQRIKEQQGFLDGLLLKLSIDNEISSSDMVDWLVEFSKVAESMHVTFDANALAKRIEGFGFRDDAYFYESKNHDFKWDRKSMEEYLIGRAINCLKDGLPPHDRFVSKYAQKRLEL